MKLILSTSFIIWLGISFSMPPLTMIHLPYKEVMRSNGIFGIDNFNYHQQIFRFNRDAVGRYGQIRFEGNQENTVLPIKRPMSSNRKPGDAWQETYANDSIVLTLKGMPIEHYMQNHFSYDVDVQLIMKGDTLNEKWIGHCKF
jgi:hypothetical protein